MSSKPGSYSQPGTREYRRPKAAGIRRLSQVSADWTSALEPLGTASAMIPARPAIPVVTVAAAIPVAPAIPVAAAIPIAVIAVAVGFVVPPSMMAKMRENLEATLL